MGVMSNLDLSRREMMFGLVQATSEIGASSIGHPDCCERIVLCEGCGSEGRIYRSTGQSDRYGNELIDDEPCPYCDGTGGEIIKTYPITLEDLEAIAEEIDQ